MRKYLGAHKDATFKNLARHATTLSKLQEGPKSSNTGSNNHMNTRGRCKPLMNYTSKEEEVKVMSIEQRFVSASSSS